MALVRTFNNYELQEAFRKMDRDYFSLEGYQAILDLFEETDCGTNTELDVIAICCDFTEEDPDYIRDNYSNLDDINEAEDDDELMEALNYHTWAIQLSNGNILYQNF